jgi:putative FmdB family regulatory protein
MPLLRFQCEVCRNRFTLLVGVTSEPDDERCPHCGCSEVVRLVSRFSRVRSEEGRLDEIADKFESMSEPSSYSEMRQMAREFGSALDEDLSDELEEALEEGLGQDGDENLV